MLLQQVNLNISRCFFVNKKKNFIDAWIITQGTNAGVVKEVGEALNKYRYTNQKDGLDIPCIGIASWGYTAGKDKLDRSLSVESTMSQDSNGNIVTKHSRYNFGIDAIQMVRYILFICFIYLIIFIDRRSSIWYTYLCG